MSINLRRVQGVNMFYAGIKDVTSEDRALNVQFENGKHIVFDDFWLRDHCRCSKCYHKDTFQRAQHLLCIPDLPIGSFQYDEKELKVKWKDLHESIYNANFLLQFDYQTWRENRRLKHVLWHGEEFANKIAKVDVNTFLSTASGAEAVFTSLLEYGVALIYQVDATVEATEKVCEALGGVQRTIFGSMWEFTTVQDHADTAYTNLPLAAHNDNTYFTEAAGLQILHCLEHSGGTGGETILTDGFYGAMRLKADFPNDFDFLTSFNVEAEYLEDGHHHRYSAPVIRIDKNEDLEQIRFNVYDRSAMAFSTRDECRAYYRSLRNLSRYYENPNNQWQFKLKPGVVMVMDNFRVLHGRTGFTGRRVLCGSYVARSDWLDKARALRLIH